MNTAELSKDHRTTADVLDLLAKGEKPKIEGRRIITAFPGWKETSAEEITRWDFLRLAPEPTPEQLNREKNEKLRKEWEKPKEEGGQFEVQYRGPGEDTWCKIDTRFSPPCWEAHQRDGDELRRKPDPQPVPWSFAEQLVGKVVVRKSDGMRALIGWQNPQFTDAVVLGNGAVTYADLLRDYTQLDGTPCGKLE